MTFAGEILEREDKEKPKPRVRTELDRAEEAAALRERYSFVAQ